MDLDLTGKVAVVTAASKGIGLAVTRALAAEGALVVAGARGTDSLAHLAGVTPVSVDLGTAEGPGQLVARAVADHGRVDILINNMGAVKLRLEGLPRDDRRRLRVGEMQMNFVLGAAGDARRRGADGQAANGRCHRQRGLRQRVLPARWRDHRLRRGEQQRC